MLIVLPGALPASPPIADELAKRLPATAPTLHAWLRAAEARAADFDPHDAGCTPYEAWQLARAGFQPAPGQQIGAGLGPLLAQATVDAPRAAGQAASPASRIAVPSFAPPDAVWIADLAHVALSTESANLLPLEALSLSAEEDAALHESARPLFAGTDFDALPLAPGRWRMRLPADLRPRTASPAAVGGQSLAGWWNQDAAVRPWRRLMNEIQMVWHDHPVNQSRADRGLPPVNTLWLYGGAAPWTPPAAASAPPVQVVEDLLPAYAAEDWGTWLQALQQLDARVLKPLSDARGMPAGPTDILLLGRDRRVDLTLKPRSRLLAWLPSSAKNWSAWWSPRA
ncbi:hypothetical protein [Achromobacter aloeverae]|uniref:Phosphoglycerate mutase n=1 Tax=Achromobacter aloeverae TaxID=1750518 RepID=A0A4Q1HL36_9BURK|nr:hypothetical protein [Achromobacter aloeverae]RXN91153.1 hypothetical protein C7R54_08160 [Achromobacter aloeverae]